MNKFDVEYNGVVNIKLIFSHILLLNHSGSALMTI